MTCVYDSSMIPRIFGGSSVLPLPISRYMGRDLLSTLAVSLVAGDIVEEEVKWAAEFSSTFVLVHAFASSRPSHQPRRHQASFLPQHLRWFAFA